MESIDVSNTSLPSTNWRYIKAKIEAHPQGIEQRPKASAKGRRARRRSGFRSAQLVVRYIGGPEASYVVCFQGKCWRYAGHLCLHDVMQHVARRLMA